MEQLLLIMISAFLSFIYSEILSIRKELNAIGDEVLKIKLFLPKRRSDISELDDSKMS